MSTPDQKSEEGRIAAWRAERQKVAEEEKAARLAARDAARAEAEQADLAAQDAAVGSLLSDLPSEGEIGPLLLARARRRRRRDLLLLLVFVLAPLMAATVYVGAVATHLHESVSVISISKLSEDGSGASQGILGALGAARGLSDVFAADAFLSSDSLSDPLEYEMGLVSLLRSTTLDPVQRLRGRDLSRFIDSAVDVQTGLLTLRVRLPDPEQARDINLRVIDLVAAHVNQIQEASRFERTQFADAALAAALAEMREARAALSALQVSTGEIDPRMRLEAAQQDMSRIESRIRELRFENDRDRVDVSARRYDIERREELIRTLESELSFLRGSLTFTGRSGASLGEIMMEHDQAQLRLEMARTGLVAAFQMRRDAQHAIELERTVVRVVAPPSLDPRAVRPRSILVLLITVLGGFSLFFLVRSLRDER